MEKKDRKEYEEKVVGVTEDGKVELETRRVVDVFDGNDVVGERVTEEHYVVPLETLREKYENKEKEVGKLRQQVAEKKRERNKYGEKNPLSDFEKRVREAVANINEQQNIAQTEAQLERQERMLELSKKGLSAMKETYSKAKKLVKRSGKG